MLVNAYKHKNLAREYLNDLWYDERYQWYWPSERRRPYELYDDRDLNHTFVSETKDGKDINGVIGYEVIMDTRSAEGFYMLRFPGKDTREFALDVLQAVDDVFTKFQLNRLGYSVVVGNPAEKMYDRWTERLGGRVEAYKRSFVTNMAGKLCDFKQYSILFYEYDNSSIARLLDRKG